MRIFISKRKGYMDIFEKKRQLIEKIACQKEDTLESKLELKQLLLKDTNGGKLYKYRSFDKDGYSLKNLEEGTLHCSLVEAFNDPFDSKFGYSFETLYKEMSRDYEKEISEKMYIFEQAIYVLKGDKEIKDFNKEEQRKINKLLQNRKIIDFWEAFKKENADKDKISLEDNKNNIIQLIMIALLDGDSKQYNGVDEGLLKLILDNMNEQSMDILANEDFNMNEFAIANGITKDVDEISLISEVWKKLCPQLKKILEKVLKIFCDKCSEIDSYINKLYLVGCLSSDFKNRLMWSHYADCHKGFCIEYDFSALEKIQNDQYLLPVLYDNKRPLFPWSIAFDQSESSIKEAQKKILLSLLTKDNVWSYEKEWRIFIRKQRSSELIMPPITCIYLGARIDNESKNAIINIANKHNIPVKQMQLDRVTYDLHAEDITNKYNTVIF